MLYQQCCKLLAEFSSQRRFEIASHLLKLCMNVGWHAYWLVSQPQIEISCQNGLGLPFQGSVMPRVRHSEGPPFAESAIPRGLPPGLNFRSYFAGWTSCTKSRPPRELL